MNGMVLSVSGLDVSSPFISYTGAAINTQLPDFIIEDPVTVVPSGHFVLDLCVSESSNHIGHTLPSGSLFTRLHDVSVSMHKLSSAYQVTMSGGPIVLAREDCGGPFAGVTLTAVSISGAA